MGKKTLRNLWERIFLQSCGLVTGNTIVRCNRCKYPNPHNATVFPSCHLAPAANPSLDGDEKTAWNLPRNEDDEVRTPIKDMERNDFGTMIQPESLFLQANSLTEQVHRTVEAVLCAVDESLRLLHLIKVIRALKKITWYFFLLWQLHIPCGGHRPKLFPTMNF